MNKIFKVIWSKTKNSYVVVSEIAKHKGKCSSALNKRLVAAFLAAGTVMSVAGSVWAESVALPAGSATATGANAVAIGASASASGDKATAIGYKAKAKGEGSFAFGEGAVSEGTGTVAFTGGNESYGTYSMSWGFNNIAGISADGEETFIGATAFGVGTEARNGGATAMGNWSIAEGQNSVAMGNESYTHEDAKAAVAMGQASHALGSGSLAGGTDSVAGGFNSFAFGYTATAYGDTAIALGDEAYAMGDESVAMGYNSSAYGAYSVAIGGGQTGAGSFEYDYDTHEFDVTIEKEATGAVAVGYGSKAAEDFAVAVGHHAKAAAAYSIALGNDASSLASSSVALGNDSVAADDDVISVGHKATDLDSEGEEYGTALNRRIVNVAEGVDDTDAVNVSQLKAAEVEVVGVGNVKVEKDTSSGHTRYTVSTTGGGGGAGISFNGDNKDAQIDSPEVLNIEGGAAGELTDGNIGVESDGKNTLTVKLAKDIKGVDSITVSKNIKVGSNTTIEGDSVTTKTVNADTVKVGDNTTIEGDAITTKTVNADTVKVGGTTINDNGITTDNGKGPSVTKDGIDGGGKKITNVAPGTADTDAVNVGQLRDASGDIYNEISRVDNSARKGIAGAAALAALHPMSFNPDDKLQFSAGVGNYRGETAAALGMFYRPAESVMFSIGGTFGNSDNMVNAGVTFGLDGTRNRSPRSRNAMAQEIVELKQQIARQDEQIARQDEQIARQDEQIARLTEMVNKLAGGGTTG